MVTSTGTNCRCLTEFGVIFLSLMLMNFNAGLHPNDVGTQNSILYGEVL